MCKIDFYCCSCRKVKPLSSLAASEYNGSKEYCTTCQEVRLERRAAAKAELRALEIRRRLCVGNGQIDKYKETVRNNKITPEQLAAKKRKDESDALREISSINKSFGDNYYDELLA